MRLAVAVVASLLCFHVTGGRAEAQGWMLAEGTRLRVTAPSISAEPMVGSVVSMEDSTLVLTAENAPLSFPLASIEQLEQSLGRSRGAGAWKGAGLGALIGPVVGTVLGALQNQDDVSGMGPMLGFISGLLYGPPMGAAVGAVLARERWQPLPIRHTPPGSP